MIYEHPPGAATTTLLSSENRTLRIISMIERTKHHLKPAVAILTVPPAPLSCIVTEKQKKKYITNNNIDALSKLLFYDNAHELTIAKLSKLTHFQRVMFVIPRIFITRFRESQPINVVTRNLRYTTHVSKIINLNRTVLEYKRIKME